MRRQREDGRAAAGRDERDPLAEQDGNDSDFHRVHGAGVQRVSAFATAALGVPSQTAPDRSVVHAVAGAGAGPGDLDVG